MIHSQRNVSFSDVFSFPGRSVPFPDRNVSFPPLSAVYVLDVNEIRDFVSLVFMNNLLFYSHSLFFNP